MTFERVGLLWWAGSWRHVDAATYLRLLPFGALTGVACLTMLWRARSQERSVWIVGLVSLALAALWRTVIHPPSGDEPAMLLAAWSWLRTGSADLSGAWDPAAAEWSRAIEFRDRLVQDHTIGRPGGPCYTYHGVVLPQVFGLLLFPFGRFGLALALVGVSALAARWTAAAATAVLGRRPSPEWLAWVLVGSPVAVYTIFTGPDLWGAALFALGLLGLAWRRPALAAAAVALLPWVHHKEVFPALGLILGAWMLSPREGFLVSAAALGSGIPEMLWVGEKIGLALWSPAAVLARHASYGAAWSPAVWLVSAPGLLVDRWAGLVWYPAGILAVAGCGWLVARGGRVARAVQAAAVPYVLALLSFSMWAGGNGAPARQLASVFPAIAVGAAVLDRRLTAGPSRTAWRVALWLSLANAHVMLFLPPLAFESARLKVEALVQARTGIAFLSLLPELSEPSRSTGPGWGAAAWMLVILVAWAGLVARLRQRTGR